MSLDDLRIRAMDGSHFVCGHFGVSSDKHPDIQLPSSTDTNRILFQFAPNEFVGSSISVVENWYRAADGLYAASKPKYWLQLGPAIPDLKRLLSPLWNGQRRSISSRGANFGTLWTYTAAGAENFGRTVMRELNLVINKNADGVTLAIVGALDPFPVEPGGPVIDDAKLDLEVQFAPVQCEFLGFGSYWNSEGRAQSEPATNGLEPAPAFSSAAISVGSVDWGQKPDPGRFVSVRLNEHEMIVHPARTIRDESWGLVSAPNGNDAPEMHLAFGWSLLGSLIADRDDARVSFDSSIGHLDGQTGRSVFESGGPMRQNFSRLELRVQRRRASVMVDGQAVLAPLVHDPHRSLGPRLNFAFSLNRTWLLAKGIRLPGSYEAWRDELPVDSVW